jgi:hypothetical protein
VPGVTRIGPGETLEWTSGQDSNGLIDAFTLSAWDGFAASAPPATVRVDVAPVNDPPSFVPGPDESVVEDSGPRTVPGWATAMTPGPPDEANQTLDFLVNHNNPALFAVPPAITPDGTLTFTPAANAFGSATVTLQLHDDGGGEKGGSDTSAATAFAITVSAVNDPPSLDPIAGVTLPEDAGPQVINLSGIASGSGEAQQLQVAVEFINPGLVAVLVVNYTSPNATGTLNFTPTADLIGAGSITVRVRDAGLDGILNTPDDGETIQAFPVTINPVNDAPSFVKGGNLSIPEDSAPQSVAGWATAITPGPPDESSQTLQFLVSSDNPSLFSAGPFLAADGTLTYTPAPHANGVAMLTVRLQDSGGAATGGADTSAPQNFTVTLEPVNDPPTPVTMVEPTNNAAFATPATIHLAATGSDIDGSITRIEFYEGTNLLGEDATEPFEFSWAGAAGGTYQVTAKAYDNLGASTVSPAITVTLTSSQSPALFQLGAATYNVDEFAGQIEVVVRKTAGGAGTVNFTTREGTAKTMNPVGFGDYQTRSGTLSFNAGESQKLVAIPITNDAGAEGDQEFYFELSVTGDGSSVQSPTQATIRIIDDEPPATTASSQLVFLPANWPLLGTLRVELEPPGANGRWRFAWDTQWYTDGTTITGLEPGWYAIDFQSVSGYVAPPSDTFEVQAGSTVIRTGYYVANGVPEYGALSVELTPPTGGWRFRGETGYRNSGSVLSNIPVGEHVVEFGSVPGYVTPPARRVVVAVGTMATVEVYYAQVEDWGVVTEPSTVPTTEIQTPETPYAFAGQLQTEVGSSSGYVVRKQVVLTAAHALFDDSRMDFANEILWFYQRHRGAYEPLPQRARGWYAFGNYAALRQAENTPGQSTLTVYDRDVAAVYFLDPAGRGGSGGYLVSDTGSNWLTGPVSKMLVGYPVAGRDGLFAGRMYATIPSAYAFEPKSGWVYATSAFRSFPGNSGGPVCALAGDGNFYPVAVYLGERRNFAESLVRVITSDVADLINRADLSAATGENNTSGGVFQQEPSLPGSTLQIGLLQVTLEPAQAIAGGALWRVRGRDGVFASATQLALRPAEYTIEFLDVPGFATPAPRGLVITNNTTLELAVPYNVPPPAFGPLTIGTNGTIRMTISGPANAVCVIEESLDLGTWTPIATNALTGGVLQYSAPLLPNRTATFLRARIE